MTRCNFEAEKFFKQNDLTRSQRTGRVPVRLSPCAVHNRFKCDTDSFGVILPYSSILNIGMDVATVVADFPVLVPLTDVSSSWSSSSLSLSHRSRHSILSLLHAHAVPPPAPERFFN